MAIGEVLTHPLDQMPWLCWLSCFKFVDVSLGCRNLTRSGSRERRFRWAFGVPCSCPAEVRVPNMIDLFVRQPWCGILPFKIEISGMLHNMRGVQSHLGPAIRNPRAWILMCFSMKVQAKVPACTHDSHGPAYRSILKSF